MGSLAYRHFDPILPTEQEAAIAKLSSRALAPHVSDQDGLQVLLEDGARITLPPSAIRMLVDILAQMAEGNAVTLIPIHAELTTQQAADFLNVSRPYFVKEVLEKGKVPFRLLGTHRRIPFKELMTYKEQQENAGRAAFHEMTQQAQRMKLGY